MRAIVDRLLAPLRRIPEIEGYEHPELLEAIYQKALAYQPAGDWPELRGVSSVLDFGGGCGHHYREALRGSPDVRWAVVETPGMVARASDLATDRLRFFADVDTARDWLGRIEIMHSNGALQYTADPIKALHSLCGVGADRMIWRRVALGRDGIQRLEQCSRLIDNGPGKAKPDLKNKIVRYTETQMPESDFLAAHAGYTLAERGPDWFTFHRLNA